VYHGRRVFRVRHAPAQEPKTVRAADERLRNGEMMTMASAFRPGYSLYNTVFILEHRGYSAGES
jgi:hypothetical protein